MTTFPNHGKLDCRVCFNGNSSTETYGEWGLLNNPGHWGSSNPEILILGFSKGLKQAKAFENAPFDTVAFKDMRHRLKDALVSIGAFPTDLSIDSIFTSDEKRFASSSMFRCTVSLNGKTSGNLIGSMFKDNPIAPAKTCTDKYLKHLPSNLKLILLLSTDDKYIEGCKDLIKNLHSETFSDVNSVSYKAGGVYWVHISHPSTENGWYNKWVNDSSISTSGRKRALAEKTVRYALA